MAPDIADLGAVPLDGDQRFGGKAAGLARLLAAGAPVPSGFAVAASAAREWDDDTLRRFRERVATLLDAGPIAIRSSAVGEDAADRSFAGLLETTLCVSDVDGAVAAAKRCLASGASPRVVAYSGGRPLAVAVLVQTMIEPRAAGVCFTRDPAGRDDAVVVEAVAGRGDALVAGRASPERWRVYRNGAGEWQAMTAAEVTVLAARETAHLAATAAKLATALGTSLDLEWCLDAGGGLWWLQARPITATVPVHRWEIERAWPEADDGPVTVWSNWNVRETMPEPLLPLTWTWWRDEIQPTITAQVAGLPSGSRAARELAGLDLVHGRIYFNLNAMLALPWLGPLLARLLGNLDRRTGSALAALRASGVVRPRRLRGSRVLLALTTGAAGVRGIAAAAAGLRPRRQLARYAAESAAVAARQPVAKLGDAELIGELMLWSTPHCRRLRGGLNAMLPAILAFALAERAFASWPRARGLLTAGMEGDPTTAIALGIDVLVEAARPLAARFADDDEALRNALAGEDAGCAWLALLDDFLAANGQRGPREFDLAAPRWADDPTMILALVRAGLAADAEPLTQRMTRLADERRREVAAAVAAAPWWRRPLLAGLARAVIALMPLREAPKHHGLVVFARVRAAALELGTRLVARGTLIAAEDVFLVELPELVAAANGHPPPDLAARVEGRRARQQRFERETPPDLLRSDGVPVPEEHPPENNGVLRGAGVSAGTASGPVAVLASPDPAAFASGDVLVVRFADPGWTPLFPRAAALVMEVGGVLCHAAVVARELGIPAVFGVPEATRRLRPGERVTVDGAAGTVRRL